MLPDYFLWRSDYGSRAVEGGRYAFMAVNQNTEPIEIHKTVVKRTIGSVYELIHLSELEALVFFDTTNFNLFSPVSTSFEN